MLYGGHVKRKTRMRHAQRDILSYGKGLDQTKVLMHHSYSKSYGGGRRAKGDPLPAHADLTRIRAEQARENVHEGALACAVLAEERVNTAPANCEVYMIAGNHTGKPLGDIAHLNGIIHRAQLQSPIL
ncbi:MAG: hypothetical protein BWY85_02168 [Firmicutes bacterium ADurb.Bin506]|nr:MAG: hypothetical protein BWY85_02168 [Firmicutes bacterium ADurb.Bin506]